MKKTALILAAFALPALAAAQTITSAQSLASFVINFINNILVPLLFAIAFIVFIWGIFQYFIAGSADEAKRKKGQQHMIWGLVGFAVMVSVWGLVHILTGTLSLNNSQPLLPTTQNSTGF